MAWVASLAETTSKAVSALVIHLRLAVDTLVGMTERQTQAQAYCDSDDLIVQSWAHGGNW